MTTPSESPVADHRAAAIQGLIDLAAFLATHPSVPVPDYLSPTISYYPGGTDAEAEAEVDRVAKLLGEQPGRTRPGHYTVIRKFGPIEYKACRVPDEDMARHHAWSSYQYSVIPDTPAASECAA